ncbi:MAG: CarD family transcriptional regulator [Lachnospiraceae bacterium]|nr:CarD family transcriptional regulator [Lachnospiraceae bacterium]
MFELGDYVVSANNGVCRIDDIVEMDMPGNGAAKKCYLVVPLAERAARLYVPVDSKKHQIRHVMTREEATELIENIAGIDQAWIESDKVREQTYKDAIFSCEPRRLVSILKTMYERGNRRQAEGKKITTIDERYFRIAEKNLNSELAFVLEKEPEEIKQLIMVRVNRMEKI